MRVILDTNIIVNNYHFNTPKFIGLFGYARRTKSKVIIPFYVTQEVLKKYDEYLTKYSQEMKKDNRVLFNKDFSIDTKQLYTEYGAIFEKLVRSGDIEIAEPSKVDSTVIFNRALTGQAPFKAGDKGIRDTLIWLNVVDIVNKNPKEDFCFITENTKDFGSKELFSSLKEDLKENAPRLFYFNSLEEFLSEYGDKIAFIKNSLIEEFLNEQYKYITSLIDIDSLLESKIEGVQANYVDSVDGFSLNDINVHEFYIYSATVDFYKVEVDFIVNLDLDLTISDPYDEFGGRTATTYGSSSCYIRISLLINKQTKEITTDPSVEPIIFYAN